MHDIWFIWISFKICLGFCYFSYLTASQRDYYIEHLWNNLCFRMIYFKFVENLAMLEHRWKTISQSMNLNIVYLNEMSLIQKYLLRIIKMNEIKNRCCIFCSGLKIGYEYCCSDREKTTTDCCKCIIFTWKER